MKKERAKYVYASAMKEDMSALTKSQKQCHVWDIKIVAIHHARNACPAGILEDPAMADLHTYGLATFLHGKCR